MDLLAVMPLLPALFLHLVRAGAFFAVVPLFGTGVESVLFRIVLSVAFGGIFWWVGDKAMAMPASMLELGVLAAREAVIGFALGFVAELLLVGLRIAGEVVGNEMGFSMAQTLDPLTGRNSFVVPQFFELVGGLLIFALDLHHDALRALAAAYEVLPVGQPFDAGVVTDRLRILIGGVIGFGLHWATPLLGVMLVVTAVFAILSRAVPNLNLMEFSFGLRILLALLAAYLLLREGTPMLVDHARRILAEARVLFA